MKSSTIKSTNSTLYMEEFNSISELVNTINSRNYNPEITSRDSIELKKSMLIYTYLHVVQLLFSYFYDYYLLI